MTQLGTKVPDALIKYLETRVTKLSNRIEAATSIATDRAIRDGGNQLVERIHEMMEELREQCETGDDDLMDRVDVFHRRLYLAEQRVEAWPVPPKKARKESKPARRQNSRQRKAA